MSEQHILRSAAAIVRTAPADILNDTDVREHLAAILEEHATTLTKLAVITRQNGGLPHRQIRRSPRAVQLANAINRAMLRA